MTGSTTTIGVGAFVTGRYRVDLVLSGGANPSLLATRYPDGEKVLIKLVRHSITERNGPLLVHLFRDAKIAHLQTPDLLPILDFDIDPATQERFLVVGYDRSRTAAQIVDPTGREERTAIAFLEIAQALLAQHEHNKHNATQEAARAPSGSMVVGANAPREPAQEAPEEWVHLRAEPVPVSPQKSTKQRKSELYALMGLIAAVGVIGLAVFSTDREVAPEQAYPWYHDYGADDGPLANYDDSDPFANDPDVRAERARRISLRSHPSGADVFVGIKHVGKTPLSLIRPGRGGEEVIRVSKPGYGETTITITWGSPQDLLVTIGGGSIGDETTKFIEELKKQNFKDSMDDKTADPKKTYVPDISVVPKTDDVLKKKDPYDDD